MDLDQIKPVPKQDISPTWCVTDPKSKDKQEILTSSFGNNGQFMDILTHETISRKESESFHFSKAENLNILDKSDFLKRMNFNKYKNVSDLDKLCVYEMKRTLVESVIEEQYAMDNVDGKSVEQSRSLFGQLQRSLQVKPRSSPNSEIGSVAMDRNSSSLWNIQDSIRFHSDVSQQSSPRPNSVENGHQNLTPSPSQRPVSQQQGTDCCHAPRTMLLPGNSPSQAASDYGGRRQMTEDQTQGQTPTLSPSFIETSQGERLTCRESTWPSPSGSSNYSCGSVEIFSELASRISPRESQRQENFVSPLVHRESPPARNCPLEGFMGSSPIYPITQAGSPTQESIRDVAPTSSPSNQSGLTDSSYGSINFIDRNSKSERQSQMVENNTFSGYKVESNPKFSQAWKDVDTSDSLDNEDVFIDVDDTGIPEFRAGVFNSNLGPSLSSAPSVYPYAGKASGDRTVHRLQESDLKMQCSILNRNYSGQIPCCKQYTGLNDNVSVVESVLSKSNVYSKSVSPSQCKVSACKVDENGSRPVQIGHCHGMTHGRSDVQVASRENELRTGANICLGSVEHSKDKDAVSPKHIGEIHKDILVSHSKHIQVHSERSPKPAASEKGQEQQEISQTTRNVFSSVSPQRAKRHSHETMRRVRGRRKSHVPLKRKKIYNDFSASSNRQFTPYAQHFQVPVAPSSEQLLNSFVHPLNYLYPYPNISGVQDPMIPISLSMPTFPQVAAYSLSNVNLPNPGNRYLDKDLHNASPNAQIEHSPDQVMPEFPTARVPFTSQRFDAGCSQYDPVFLNKLFQQWCTAEQNKTGYPASSTYADASLLQATKSVGTKSKTEQMVSLCKETSKSSQPMMQASNRTEINSNEELAQYFNLLFNPSGYKPKEKSCGQKVKLTDMEHSEHEKSTNNKADNTMCSSKNHQTVTAKTVSGNHQKRRPKIISIDLTDDDSCDPVITNDGTNNNKREQSASPNKNCGFLTISVTDELWTAADAKLKTPELRDSDMIVKDSANIIESAAKNGSVASKGTVRESDAEKSSPKKPYVPKFFQSLPQDAIDKVELLESIKKWTGNNHGDSGLGHSQRYGHTSQSQGQDDDCETETGGEVQAQVNAGEGQGQGQSYRHNNDRSANMNKDERKKEDVNKTDKNIPVLDAMDNIIIGLLGQGVVDLSLATKSVNELFQDKLNGTSKPCSCSFRRRPATMSRSMVAHANAIKRAKERQAIAVATFRKSNGTMEPPITSVQRAETVFPEMIQAKQVMNKPVVPSLFPQPSPPKRSKIQSSTIRHYGPKQMSDNVSKPSFKELVMPEKLQARESGKATFEAKSKLRDFGSDFPPAFVGKSQFPFVLNEYPPFSLIPNAHKMYSDYISQKRSLEMLQSHFCLPVPMPIKRPRLLFGEEGKDLNGPALCSV
jgi:hypothetical protein